MSEFDHLWNDLPITERHRLMPTQIENQILHLKQSRNMVVKGHKRTLAEMDDWIKNLERSLKKYSSVNEQSEQENPDVENL